MNFWEHRVNLSRHIVISLLALSAAAKAQSTDVSFSLENAVAIAIERSPKVRAVEAKLDETRAMRGAAQSEFMPRVGIAAGLEKNPAVSESSERIAYGYASWNLFNGFADRRNTQLASFEVARSELELAATKFALRLEVEAQFFKILGAIRSMNEWTEAAALNGAALKDVRMRRSAGMASEGDFVAFEVRQSRIEAELAAAKSAVELEKAGFNRLLGHELGQAITFGGLIPRFELNEPINQILASAHQSAFALRASAIDVAKSDVETARWVSGMLPRIDFEARNGWLPLGERPTSQTGSDTPATALLLTAKMELFSGLSTINERRAALARKSQSEEKLREASADLLSQVEGHVRRLVLMEQRLRVEAENSTKTAKYKDATSREYRAGVKTSMDYASAIDLAIEARRRYVDSLLAWHEERFGLENAIGRRVSVKEVANEVK